MRAICSTGFRYLLASAIALCPSVLLAQNLGPGRLQRSPPSWATQLSGYWVSLISQNWRMRMVTPAKGDYAGIPLTAAAAEVADAWDPAKDTANRQQCRSYGAAAIMIRPERLHIVWQDQQTLVMDIDSGMQHRVLYVGGSAPPDAQLSWQGYSSAQCVSRATAGFVQTPPDAQNLQVTTTRMLPGYLRQNGIPYSDKAVLTENYDLDGVSDSELYLVVTTSVTDPTYLDYPLVLSAVFQKQASDAGWHPTPCSSIW